MGYCPVMRTIDLTGRVVGRWTVVARVENDAVGGAVWLCRCECGVEKRIRGLVLRDGRSRSCGCLRVDTTVARSTKHGFAPSGRQPPTYHSWLGMKARCTNPKHKSYPDYGGRGIKVCERWMAFENFYADMGEKPARTSLERANNEGNYEPGNCYWASPTQQANNMRSNRVIAFRGVSRNLGEWAATLRISKTTLAERLSKWPIARALSVKNTPPSKRARNRLLTWNGETMNLTEWAKRQGLTLRVLHYRVSRGWTTERALSTPMRRSM